MFTENLAPFFDTAAGFAVAATLAGASVSVILDAPGAEVFGSDVVTTEPSILLRAGDGAAAGQVVVILSSDLPTNVAALAGTYTVRSVMPEAPDGAIVRAFLAKTS